MEIVTTILQPMSNVTRPQRKFMQVLLPLLICLRGRANFRNFSRYSNYHEKTFSHWYRRGVDLVEFKHLSLIISGVLIYLVLDQRICKVRCRNAKPTIIDIN
jgi:hypothetical protein